MYSEGILERRDRTLFENCLLLASRPGTQPRLVLQESGRTRTLATLGVVALVILLLAWGFSAMQWTLLTTNNNVPDALTTSSVPATYGTYSIPQGTERDYSACFDFQTTGSPACGSGPLIHPGRTLPSPADNLSTTIDDYVVFKFTNPNGTALMVWYSGPEGNLTQDCGGRVIPCIYQPSPQGSRLDLHPIFFKINTAGNYTLHLLSIPCTSSPSYCTTTTAVGTFSLASSSLTYSRPYWIAGLATVIAVVASIAIILAYFATADYRRYRGWPKHNHPPQSIPQKSPSTNNHLR